MDKVVRESAFIFDGIKTKKAQKKIVNLLKCCKELRDTAYPLKNSLVTEVKLLDLHAQKQKDYIYVTGTLLLEDLPAMEKRTFEAYITNKDKEYHILLTVVLDIFMKKYFLKNLPKKNMKLMLTLLLNKLVPYDTFFYYLICYN